MCVLRIGEPQVCSDGNLDVTLQSRSPKLLTTPFTHGPSVNRTASESLKRVLIYIWAILAIGITTAATQTPSAPERTATAREQFDTVVPQARARVTAGEASAINREPFTLPSDSAHIDSLYADRTEHTLINRKNSDIDNPVTFSAKDSIVFYNQSNAHMFGNSTVEYGEFKLNAGHIQMDMDSSTVYAAPLPDSISAGEDTRPVFRDKSGEYESGTMKYNFKTQRGYISDVVSEQGEGYLTGGRAKKMEDGSFYVADGKYTTCDNHDHPHFYFKLTKARIMPKKNVVTGPAYMVLADVPLPLAVPFGFFPFSKDYSSGIIFPSFGDDYNKGFYLRDGGYYFAISDNIDLALRGEIYTKGSWGVNARSNYVKRYRYRGNFEISYITTITGDKGAPDYAKANNFRIAWTHQQDAKANPFLSFSSSVNFTTSGYTRNDLNSYYSNAFTENTKSSTVNLTYRPPNSKWTISATANIAQRTQDSTLSVSFPNLNVALAQTAPFKRKRAVGGEKWYEKIRISYSGQFQNQLTANQSQFFKKNLIKDWNNGISHQLPVQATFTVLKYLNLTPSIRINDRMYFQKISRQWDPNASAEVCDTTHGFYNLFDFSASLGLTTKIYGFWKPLKFMGNKIQMIRHVITPSISFSGAPDFGAPGWGIWGHYYRPMGDGMDPVRVDYNYFQNTPFGAPSRGKSAVLSYSFANNLEMKVRSDKDSTGVKKISLIENLTIGQSYNFAADSLRFSNINTSIMLRLIKGFNLNLNATWDPYMYELDAYGAPRRVDKLRISHGKGIAKLTSTGTSFSYTFNNNTFRRNKKEQENENSTPDDDNPDNPDDNEDDFGNLASQRRKKNNNNQVSKADADGYAPWECPWSLTFNYSVNYGWGEFDYNKLEYKGKWTQNLSVSGSLRPTPNWNFNMSASYNFDLHKISYMNCSVSRDLHCFTMTCSFIPVGPYKSFNFHIAVKASMLRDLKWDKRSSTRNGIRWY